jgi:predicted kinase
MSTVFLVTGQICAGKSSVAKIIEKHSNAVRLSIDELMRKKDPNKLIYKIPEDDVISRNMYNTVLKIADYIIDENINIVLDCCFYRKYDRTDYIKLLKDKKCGVHIVYVKCSDNIIQNRLHIRNDNLPNDAFRILLEEYNCAKKFFDEPTEEEISILINNDMNYEDMEEDLINQLDNLSKNAIK